MATTDEALQKKQDHVVDLRQKVVDANAQREAKERELVNDITAEQLDIEAVRLEVELAEALRLSKALDPPDVFKPTTPPVTAPPVTAAPAATEK